MKRQNRQQKLGHFVAYGKPAEVEIEHLAPNKQGQLTRYIEHMPGYSSSSSDSVAKAGPDRGDLHPGHCKGRLGVARTWTRDNRTWCLGCYQMRYGALPSAQELTPDGRRHAPSAPKKVSRKDFGL